MNDQETLAAVIEATDRRRDARRSFLKYAGAGTAAVGGLAMLGGCFDDDDSSPTPTPTATPTPTPTATSSVSDVDILNFALNLEYLEAQFYSFAVFGTGLPAAMLTGTGTQGAVTGGKAVPFADPVVAQYAREIASDEIAHVAFLRSQLGTSAVAQPAINIDGSATGAFTAAARAAGVVGATDVFDPYANDGNFLLGAFIFEDVGVTAYKGSSTLITNKTYLDAAAGILAVEAYHAGLIRTALYSRGVATPALRTNADKISDARDGLDGTAAQAGPPTLFADDDQGITGTSSTSNVVPADANGLAYSRTTGQVLNIVYLSKSSLAAGGFFPAGVNGNIKTSAASG